MRRRRNESGFALLLVFLMASVIGITLYLELPREAFESQRQKEQMLIERGEQYKIAIRRFVQANPNRWPGSMDELESFNNRRFLRHRYKDPMTGKDEWRLIHIQNGVLTDSKLNKNKNDQTKNANPNTFIQEMAGLAGAPAGSGSKNTALRQRPSDGSNLPGMSSGATVDPNNPIPPPGSALPPLPGAIVPGGTGTAGIPQPGQPVPGQPVYGNTGIPQPGTTVPAGTYAGAPGYGSQPVYPPGVVPGMQNTNGTQASGGGFIGNQPGLGSSFIGNQPGLGSAPTNGGVSIGPNGQPIYPGQQGYPGQPGMPVNSQTGGVSPYPVAPGVNGGVPNQAANMINNILTQPRPGGMPVGLGQPGFGQPNQQGVQTVTGSFGAGGGFGSPAGGGIGSPIGGGGPGGQTIGGGIAGVASNDDEDSIMEYGDQTNYSLWEFVFDPTKWHAPPNPNVGSIGTPISQTGSGIGSSIGSPIGSGPIGGSPGGGSPIGGMNTGITGGTNTGIPGSSPLGGQTGQSGQMGTGGMPSGSSAFGSGGLVNIRPGRR